MPNARPRSRRAAGEPTAFEREYLVQTRREIDTEKQERDRLLNFATAFVGIVMAAVLTTSRDGTGLMRALQSHAFAAVAAAVLVVVSSLMWVRVKKLTQIADRWCVLHGLLKRWGRGPDAGPYLEHAVVESLASPRYVAKDVVLNLALCSPVYIALAMEGDLARISLALVHLCIATACLLGAYRRWVRRARARGWLA